MFAALRSAEEFVRLSSSAEPATSAATPFRCAVPFTPTAGRLGAERPAGEEGIQRSPPLRPVSPRPAACALLGGSFPSAPPAPRGPYAQQGGRAGRCQAHGGAAAAQHFRVSAQPGRSPGGWRGEAPRSPGERRCRCFPPVAAPLRTPSLQSLPVARRRGRGGAPLTEETGQALSAAEGTVSTQLSHTRTHAPTCRAASCRPPAPSSSRAGSPRHLGNAAPLPPLLRRRGPGSGDRRQPISGPRPTCPVARRRWRPGVARAPRRGEAVTGRYRPPPRGAGGAPLPPPLLWGLPASRCGLLPARRCVPGAEGWGMPCTVVLNQGGPRMRRSGPSLFCQGWRGLAERTEVVQCGPPYLQRQPGLWSYIFGVADLPQREPWLRSAIGWLALSCC